MSEVSQRRRDVLICLCLAVVTIVVYRPLGHFPFTYYDDDMYVTGNPDVQAGLTLQGVVWAFTTGHFENWHPLTWLSHMLDCQLFGLNAGAHHLVSVLIHVANTLLLFFVLQRMTAAPWRSALVAALFAWHPLHVESVAWVAERKDVLSTCFWLLTMLAYVRYVETLEVQDSRFRVYYSLALLFFALGLMAKPMVVTLPFVLLLLDDWPLGRRQWLSPSADQKSKTPWHRLVMEKIPFFVLAAASCLVIYSLQYMGGDVAPLKKLPMNLRVANAVVAYVRYLGKAVWPVELAVFYPYRPWPWPIVLAAAAVLAGISGWVIWRAPRARYLIVGWLWYVGTLVPVIGLVQAGDQSMADRYTYIPLIGLFLIVVWAVPWDGVERGFGRVVVVIATLAVLAFCVVLTGWQVSYWENSETLFRHALNVTKDNFVAHYNLGQVLFERGKFGEAMAEYREAVRIHPNHVEAHNNVGLALAGLGKTEEAVAEYREALRIDPRYVKAHNNVGLALAGLGKTEEAVAEYREALRINPGYAEAHYSVGVLLAMQGKTEEAVAQYREAVRLRPDWPRPLGKLAWLLATAEQAGVRNGGEAVQLAERLCELTGQRQAEAPMVLAAAYAEAGRFAEASQTAQKAIQLARDNAQQDTVVRIEGQLKLYQAGRACHEGGASSPLPQ